LERYNQSVINIKEDKMDNNAFEKIAARIDGSVDDMIKLEGELTAIPAIDPRSDGEGEWKKAKFIRSFLEDKLKVDEIKQYNCPDKSVPEGTRPNIVAKIKGKSSEKTIWIMSHIDVVPAGELSLWKTDPFKIKVEGGKIYGRGVEDNQQGMVSSFFAIKAFRDEGILPEYDTGLVLVSDEETGNEKGIVYLLDKCSDFKKTDLIIVPDGGNEEGTMIEVAEKSILWLKFRTVGKQAHASMPQKAKNSFRAASYLVTKLDALYKLFPDKDPLFNPPYSTFEPTKKEPNVPNINSIPGDDVFYLDSRLMPNYKLEEVEARIRKMADEIEKEFGVKISFERQQAVQAPDPTPSDAPVVEALKKAVSAVYNKQAKPMGIGGGTVAAYFRMKGFPAAVWSKLDETAHQPNEYCIIDNLVGDTKVFAHIMLKK
jgi:succinyl-diaminopimelate desuccinylase